MGIRLGLITLLLLSVIGCRQSISTSEFVARVGDAYLHHSDLKEALEYLPHDLDSAHAKTQIINRWIGDELLYQEALRLDLSNRKDIQKRLNESARSVLIDGIISEFDKQADNTISFSDIQQYYLANMDHLNFFEPFVQIRYLSHRSQDTLILAMQQLTQGTVTDSIFEEIVRRYSRSPEKELKMAQNYFLETTLFVRNPEVSSFLKNTTAGSPPQIIEVDSIYHLIHVIDRRPSGVTPELSWVEGFIREQLMIRSRKQNYSQNVQRLRLDAEFNNKIEIK